MVDKILTLDELRDFCAQQGITTFSAQEYGKPIACQVYTTAVFEDADEEDEDENNGIIYAPVKVCHTLLNRNGSYIAEDTMKNAMPTLKDRPLLAFIHKLPDGTLDFGSHNREIVEDENGDKHVVYYERQVGSFTSDDPYLEYDKDNDKTYVMAKVAIPTDYSPTYSILRDKGGECKVSCELIINAMEYNAQKKYLEFTDFYFAGATLLGSDENGIAIDEGMQGASIDASASFDHEENTTKGGSDFSMKFKELLNKYNKTAEEITFDYASMSDEELEAKFAEEFGNTESESAAEPETNSEPESENMTLTFELSHEDIRSQIYNILEAKDRENNYRTSYMIVHVFDDRFIYEDYASNNGHFFAQAYAKDDSTITLDGDPYEVFPEFLTADEKASLDTMRANYASLADFKEKADKAAFDAQRDAVLSDASYECLADDAEFAELKEHKADYSVDDLKVKADLIFAKHIKAVGSFAMNSNADTTPDNTRKFNIADNSSADKDDPYPGLFKD